MVESYIEKLSTGAEKIDAVSFLIYLATLPSGQLLKVDSLSASEQSLLIDWATLGLVKILETTPFDTDAMEIDIEDEAPRPRRRASRGSVSRVSSASSIAEAETQNATFFCVTPLAWQIVSSSRENLAGGTEIGKWKRGIIVESNFMLYAYTDSEVLIALLDLFAEVSTRLPNLCIARISRRSVRDAFRRGISAEQICRYLQQNRHNVHLEKQRTAAAAAAARLLDRDAAILMGDDSLLRLESTGSVVGTHVTDDDTGGADDDNRINGLPEQVSEQIQLWEEERSRFQAESGYMYDDFDGKPQFQAAEKYARDLGVLVWANAVKMALFVAESGHEAMKAFIRKQATAT